jgi:hypothetical protein
MFVLVNPLSATPLFSPLLSIGRAERPCSAMHHSSPLSMRWWVLELVHSIFSCHRVSPDLSAMASPTLVIDPSDVARRVIENNLRVVWRGSQRVNYLCCMYVLLYVCWPLCLLISGGIVGGGGTINTIIISFIFVYFITHWYKLKLKLRHKKKSAW